MQSLSWKSNYQHIEELATQQIFLNVLSGPYPHITTHLGPILIIPFHLHLGSLQRTHTWSFQTTVTKRFFIFFHVWVKTHLLILLITVTVKYKNLIKQISSAIYSTPKPSNTHHSALRYTRPQPVSFPSNRSPGYTECPRRNVPNFGRVFLRLKYTDITQNTYIQSWTVTEIMAREVWNFDSCYILIDYQIHIKTGRNMWFL